MTKCTCASFLWKRLKFKTLTYDKDYFAIFHYTFYAQYYDKVYIRFRHPNTKAYSWRMHNLSMHLKKSGKIIKARKSMEYCVKEQKEWAVEWARKQISLYVAMSTLLDFMFFVHRSIRKHTMLHLRASTWDVTGPWRNHSLRLIKSSYYNCTITHLS